MKTLIFDLDGTLFNSHSLISKKTIKTLQSLHCRGFVMGIASGRPVRTIEIKLEKFNLKNCFDFAIGMNGSHVKDFQSQELIAFDLISPQDTTLIIDHFYSHGFAVFLSSETTLYSPKSTLLSKAVAKGDYLNEEVSDYTKEKQQSWPKILVMSVNKLDEIMKLYAQLDLSNVIGRKASNFSLEFTNNKTNKGVGVKKICELKNIDLNDVICFGDANNDIPMFEVCGKAICVGNGTAEAKKAADEVIGSNRFDGVEKYLRRTYLK